jgi:hypothetical protein
MNASATHPFDKDVLEAIALRYLARLLGHAPTMADAARLPGIDLRGLPAHPVVEPDATVPTEDGGAKRTSRRPELTDSRPPVETPAWRTLPRR